jgi:type VI secretion system ImpM family protein
MVIPMPRDALTAPRPILFGKLPAHGDFVARNLSPGAQAAWDAWACREIEGARDALGDDFEPAHEAAQPRRFVVRPGPFGPGWGAGVISTSVDSAGRRFLIVLAADRLEEATAAEQGPALAAGLEDVVYLAFEQGMNADAVVAAAEAALANGEASGEEGAPAPMAELGDGGGLVLEMLRAGLAGAEA